MTRALLALTLFFVATVSVAQEGSTDPKKEMDSPNEEAAILAAGYAPAVGFVHTGKPQSFVYDIADIFKFDTVVPVAFKIAARKPPQPERAVRIACRDAFRQNKTLMRIIPTIEEVLAAGGIPRPKPPPESVAPVIPNKEQIGDAGHRG